MPDLQLDFPQSDMDTLKDYVQKHGVRRKLRRGERLVAEGEDTGKIFFIRSGSFKCVRGDSRGREGVLGWPSFATKFPTFLRASICRTWPTTSVFRRPPSAVAWQKCCKPGGAAVANISGFSVQQWKNSEFHDLNQVFHERSASGPFFFIPITYFCAVGQQPSGRIGPYGVRQ